MAGKAARDVITRQQIPYIALILVIIAVLVPSVNYSMSLRSPTPAQLLVAICIGLFSSVVCLWVLDSVSVLPFRSEWVSRSVYGAAIVSVIGTSVGVYQGALAERQNPFEGQWQLRVTTKDAGPPFVDHALVLTYSTSAGTYWGYSETRLADAKKVQAAAVEVVSLHPKDYQITLRVMPHDGAEMLVEQHLSAADSNKRFVTADGENSAEYNITLERPR